MLNSNKFKQFEMLLTILCLFSGINVLLYKSLIGTIAFSAAILCFIVNTFLFFYLKSKE